MWHAPRFPGRILLSPRDRGPITSRRSPRRRRSAVFRLEHLEDRTVLSTVTSLADGGPGTLRQAILDANSTPGDDTITVGVQGTINLASVLPDLSTNIALQGPGASLLTVRRNTGGNYRIFTVDSGATVTLSGLTISNGGGADAVDYIDGTGIENTGTLTLNNATVSGNLSWDEGGGIDNRGTLTLNNSTVSGNLAYFGGGIDNRGTLTLNNSTVSDNGGWDLSFGGGILNWAMATATVTGSTISGNYCGYYGGGIDNMGMLTLGNSTVSGNSATSGGGISNWGTIHARDTIVAGNNGWPGFPDDLSGGLGSLGHNLIGNTSGGSGFRPDLGDLLNVDPRLGPLQDNGGPTFTQALLPGSPAIDAGDNTGAPPFDQRGTGYPRIVGGTIDIGAFEVQAANSPPVLAPIPDQAVAAGQVLTLTPQGSDPDGDRLAYSARVESMAYHLDQTLGLYSGGNYYYNWGGRQEKWVQGNGGAWYFILPSGAFYRWDGGGATGTLLAQLNPSYYNDPTTLTGARSEAQAYVLHQALGLYSAGNDYYNWGGKQEKWLQGSGGQWYFLLPSGAFYRWDGSPQATGTLLATVDPSYWSDPQDLRNAPISWSVSGDVLTLAPAAGYVGSFWVTATADDGHGHTASQSFALTVGS
jgi:hypothetical protein